MRLKLLTPSRDLGCFFSVVNHIKGYYISSAKFSYIVHYLLKNSTTFIENLRRHGPCSSFYTGRTPIDYGMCCSCQFWPSTATSLIATCQLKQWPTQNVMREIISNEFHVMPIGSNSADNESELEWRLSFSDAERQIIYSFSHTQFLCYGMFKIFLKEVLSLGKQESLICSYFLKTVLFWGIQNNPDDAFWCPSNLLTCFWLCCKRLCKCAFDANCPNLFITENNMFKHKVIGASREALLFQLNCYYEMGESCLFLSPTIRSNIGHVLFDPLIVHPIIRGHNLSSSEIDWCIASELIGYHLRINSREEAYIALKLTGNLVNLLQLPHSQFQLVTLQYVMSSILIQTAFILAKQFERNKNKTWYKLDRKIINMLRLSSRTDPVCQVLCLAVYFYNTCRYHKVQDIIKLCSHRRLHPYNLCDVSDVDSQQNLECFCTHFLYNRLTKAWRIRILYPISYLSEFKYDLSLFPNNDMIPQVSFCVSFHTLNVLSKYRLGKRSKVYSQ